MQKVLGGSLDPHAAYMLIRGMKTLKLRVLQQNETCMTLARRLEAHPKVWPGVARGRCWAHVMCTCVCAVGRGDGGALVA